MFDQLLERARTELRARTGAAWIYARTADFPVQLHDRRARVGVFRSARRLVRRRGPLPEIRAIVEADVWDERADGRSEPREEIVPIPRPIPAGVSAIDTVAAAPPRYFPHMFKSSWVSSWVRGERYPLQAALGRLEREVMDVMWTADPDRSRAHPVRDVQSHASRARRGTRR